MPGEEKPLQIILYGAIISILAALVTALLNEGSVWMRVRTLLAGLCCGMLLSWVLRSSDISQFYKDVIISLGAAFVAMIWPVVRNLLRKYIHKKGDDITNS